VPGSVHFNRCRGSASGGVAAAAIEQQLGPIDVWVNNAMASVFAPVSEIHPEEFRRVTEVTYLGVVYGTLSALERMRPRDRGVIVQVGSALAYRGIPLQSAYCASKHAIQGFTESLRCELMHEESAVRVTDGAAGPHSIRRSSTRCAPVCHDIPNRSHRSTSPRWRPVRSSRPPGDPLAGSGGSVLPQR